MVIRTWGMTAPVESLAVPRMVPVSRCAQSGSRLTAASTKKRPTDRLSLVQRGSLRIVQVTPWHRHNDIWRIRSYPFNSGISPDIQQLNESRTERIRPDSGDEIC